MKGKGPLKEWDVDVDEENGMVTMTRPCPGEKGDRLLVMAATSPIERAKLLAEREAYAEEIRIAHLGPGGRFPEKPSNPQAPDYEQQIARWEAEYPAPLDQEAVDRFTLLREQTHNELRSFLATQAAAQAQQA